MEIALQPTRLCGEVKAIASKSQAHRYLICAALSDRKTRIKFEEESEDIIATINCLRAMGAVIEKECDGYSVSPILQDNNDCSNKIIKEDIIVLNCNESGSTLRFLLPIVAALEINGAFYPKGRLSNRPLNPLYEQMIMHGCSMSLQGEVPFYINGKLLAGTYEIPADVSSQFISGLIFSLPMLEGDSVIKLIGKVESSSYINMTIEAVRCFGISICWEDDCIIIKGNQKYRTSSEVITIEGDWSNAAFWLCAGAISNEGITCTNLNIKSLQGDKSIINIIKEMGANVMVKDNCVDNTNETHKIIVEYKELKSIEVDANDIPDLVPIIAAIASVADGTSRIYNARRLRLKESDRLKTVSTVLNQLGADIIETEDALIINGKKRLKGGRVSSHNDHRIAMMASIASLVCDDKVIIEEAEAVNKSYPTFYNDLFELCK